MKDTVKIDNMEDKVAELNEMIQKKLQEDVDLAAAEVQGILEKFNLVQIPMIQQTWGPSGLADLKAGIVLGRPPKKDGTNG